MQQDILTATRQATLLGCMRKHYWRHEVRLVKTTDADALRFGSAWHKAMETRGRGGSIEEAFNSAIAEAVQHNRTLDEIQVATLSGMLAGYFSRYHGDTVAAMHPEVEFRYPILGSRAFVAAGKIDGLCTLADGRLVLREYKTAGYDLSPDSDYWLRLRCNIQIMQYVWAARQGGWDVHEVEYDVARKPMIAPKQIPAFDEQGRKIVNDAQGRRVFKSDNAPRESADAAKGYILVSAVETPEQFGDRLHEDATTRPDFYFQRREVPVLDDDLAEFLAQRLELARLVLSLRRASRKLPRPEQAWPRNVGEMTCRWCEYAGFCLQNGRVDTAAPPCGFRIGTANPELTQSTGDVA